MAEAKQSERCRISLEQPPACDAPRKEKSLYAICYAWNKVKTQNAELGPSMSEGWKKVKEVCIRRG